ncbi:MAG TPA: kelch repeat-containing protein [Verrucomicrobiae bacterium]|jgi:hypothetical protein
MKNYSNSTCKISINITLGSLALAAAMSAFFPAMPAAAASQTLSGTALSATARFRPMGHLDSAKRMRLAISLPLRHQKDLEGLLQQIYDPISTNYHQYLAPDQFTQKFGPTQQDYEAVMAFARANNLTVASTHSNRRILDVIGAAADVEKALHVNMMVYQHPTEARTFYAPDAEPSLNLSAQIQGIEGLNNYALPHPACSGTALGAVGNVIIRSGPGSGPGGTYWGSDFRSAYAPGVALNGAGQSIGLLEFDGYAASDIAYYENYAASVGESNLPNVAITNVLLDGFDGQPSGTTGSLEATLDVDMAIAMAPGMSSLVVYEAPPDNAYWHDLLNRMADDDIVKQISCSWFSPSGSADPVAEQIFEQMAAQGQSVFVISGDFDANVTNTLISFPEDSPHVTVVGGTELVTTGPQGSWLSESVWNFDYAAGCANYAGLGSSGGISATYTIPPWQAGIDMSANQGSTTMRNIPDVSLAADEVFVYTNGVNVCVDGTSCATPLWAAFAALANQQAASVGAPPLGFLNPALYAISAGSRYALDFHDTATGNNEWQISPARFSAAPGYDLCTGLGTPSGQDLINDLVQSGSCQLSPGTALNTARQGSTATLLPNGLVLAAGGTDANGVLASAELYNPATGAWTATGSMKTARANHMATLLPSGLVLAAGGMNAGGTPITTAELYNPATGAWTATGALTAAREYPTATLLPNGLVLAAGGLGTGNRPLSTSELYNPATGKWASSGFLHAARAYHTATLLPSGFVLAAGGVNASGNSISNAEIYNPTAGTWAVTGSLNMARDWHTATLLPNGLVLAAGGIGASGNTISSAELYNPVSGRWTNCNPLNTAREAHSATLLPNGLVFVSGGENFAMGLLASGELYDPLHGTWDWTCSLNTARLYHTATLLPDGLALMAGGEAARATLASAELYAAPPADTKFDVTGSMNLSRTVGTATLLPNGQVLAAGGYNYTIPPIADSELFNLADSPNTGAWTNTGSLNTGRYSHTATLLPNDSVLVAGGENAGGGDGGPLASAERYNPITGAWTNTGAMNDARVWHTATLLPNGLVLVAGGYNYSAGILASAELYNSANGTWTRTGSLHAARVYHSATLLPNGQVLVAGGGGASGVLASAELYNPAAGIWSVAGLLNTPREWHTATLLPNGMVLAAGGDDAASYLASAELYNPASGTWTATGPLNAAREYHTATLLPSGLVLAAGGLGANGVLASAELFNPAAGTWEAAASLNTARRWHTSTLLPNGFVLIAGGDDSGGDFFGGAELYAPY